MEFETALVENVIPGRGEKYTPDEHDLDAHRLNPIHEAVRGYARPGTPDPSRPAPQLYPVRRLDNRPLGPRRGPPRSN